MNKLDKIVHNISEKEHERLREMLERGELLGGSKGNACHIFLRFLLKMIFSTLIANIF